MNALGSISQIYMLVLLILLAVGIGLAIWRFISFLMGKISAKEDTVKKKPGIPISSPAGAAGSLSSQNGGSFMKRNGWLNLAAFSLAGLLVSVIFMGFMYSKNNTSQQAFTGNGHQDMQAQGGMNINMPMGNVQMQGAMYGNGAQNDYYQQQIYGMQQQLTRLQQQMGSGMSGNMQMQQSGMDSMNSMMDDMMSKMDTMMNTMSSSNNMNGSGSMDSMMNEMMSKMDTMMNMMSSVNNMNGMNNSSSMNGMNGSSNMNGMMDDMMNMMDDMMGMMNNMQQQNNNSSSSSMPMM